MIAKLDLSAARVKKAIVHQVGNKFRDEGLILSDAESERSAALDELLLKYFLLPVINSDNQYILTHESDINLNPIKHYSSLIFKDENEFFSASSAIAKHLYISSAHPNIGGGEFIEILYDSIKENNMEIQAIGLFRIETRSSYLDVKNHNGIIDIVEKQGISIESIQKGAVILSTGDTVFIVDSLGKKTKYWLDSFLKVAPKNTTKKYTRILSDITKAVAKKIDTPTQSLNFSQALSCEKELTVNKLKNISTQFIESSHFESIVDGVAVKYGMPIDDNFSVKEQRLSKQIKDIASKINISSGVNIVLSEPTLKVLSIDVQPTNFGLRAVIDIKKGE